MFCRFCGATLPDDSTFCHSCGRPLAATATGPGMRVAAVLAPMPGPALQRRTRGKALKVGIGLTIGILLGIVVIAGAFLWFMNPARSNSDSSGSSGSQPFPIREPRVMSLVDTAFTLNAAQGMNWHFNKTVLPAGAGTYHLVFDNKFSPFTPKAVSANIRLRYTL
jgi:hypothetical protein